MGLFSRSTKATSNPKPYRQDAHNLAYDLLFCDDIDLYRTDVKVSGYPWNTLLAKKPEIDKLKVVAGPSTIDSRHKLLACSLLQSLGSPIHKKELYGVVVEVASSSGLDVIAAYSDGTARHMNHTGKMNIWDAKTEASGKIITQLFSDSMNVVHQIEPLDKERQPFPHNGRIKLTFLVSDGMYFWEGPFDLMHKDSLAGPVIDCATDLLTHLSSAR